MPLCVRHCLTAITVLTVSVIRPCSGAEDAASDESSGHPAKAAVATETNREVAVQQAAPSNADGLLLAQSTPAGTGQPAQRPPQISEAERIARLQRNIEMDGKALEEIQSRLVSPESEYRKAESEFQQLDTRLEEAKKRLVELQQKGEPQAIEQSQSELAKLEEQWKLAKDRFEIAIQERKTTQEKVGTLTKKLQQDREALDKLTGTESAPAEGAAAPGGTPPPGARGQSLPAAPQANQAPAAPAAASVGGPAGAAGSTAEQPPATSPITPFPAVTVDASAPASPAPAAPPAATEPDKPVDKELQQATEEAQQKEAAAQDAEKEAKSVGERMELLQKDIALERDLLKSARKKADNAEASQAGLEEEFQTKTREGGDAASLRELQTRISDARRRFREARTEGRERASRLDELQSRYAALQSEQLGAMQQADDMRKEADSALDKVEHLRNPFTLRNTLQWLIDHGPRIVVILIAMAVALCMSRIVERRIVGAMVKRGGLGKRAERENRARTLVSVFQNAGNVAIIGGGTLMVLDIIGAPITALMGGAAVFGLAVAFGAQNLIKDYFYGFMILLEQQYTINDVIRIGDIAGQVERITLRMTVLRDLEGRVHFIPHGQITATTNMTHGWSRAVFDIGVAYKEDVDRVIAIIQQIGLELREEAAFRPLIMEDLTMLGLDALGDSAIVIKFFIKTRPLKQWEVKREMLRRIKRTFDEQGIEIPFPHRTVYHRQEDSSAETTPDQFWAGRKSA